MKMPTSATRIGLTPAISRRAPAVTMPRAAARLRAGDHAVRPFEDHAPVEDGTTAPWQSGQSGQVIPAPLIRIQLPRTPARRPRSRQQGRTRGTSSEPTLDVPATTTYVVILDPVRPTSGIAGLSRRVASDAARSAGPRGDVALAGCREVRVNQVRTGTTTVAGPNQVWSCATSTVWTFWVSRRRSTSAKSSRYLADGSSS